MVNDTMFPSPHGRRPRGIVKINDTIVPGWIEFTVDNNSYLEADTWSVTYAASALPKSFNANWFSQQLETFVEIIAGIPIDPANPSTEDRNMQSLVYGRIDNIEYDPARQTLHLTGRDMTGAFIDTRIVADYSNQRSWQIATALANAHGLKPDVTKTKDPVGTYYNLDTMLLHTGRSEWDLLTYLARHEGFAIFVAGKTLYFGPDTSDSTDPYILRFSLAGDKLVSVNSPTLPDGTRDLGGAPGPGYPTANFESISLSRSQTVAKGITVTVMSGGKWYPGVRYSYPFAPRPIAPGKSSAYGATTDYYYTMPSGSNPVQVQQRAQNLYNQIIQHAMKFTAVLQGNNLISSQSRIELHGTGTSFDQIYYVKAVSRTMSFEEGYTMRVDAQNASPNLEQSDDPGEPQADPLAEIKVTAQPLPEADDDQIPAYDPLES